VAISARSVQLVKAAIGRRNGRDPGRAHGHRTSEQTKMRGGGGDSFEHALQYAPDSRAGLEKASRDDGGDHLFIVGQLAIQYQHRQSMHDRPGLKAFDHL